MGLNSKMLHLKGISELHAPLNKAYVTIGNFDGLHHGHRRIISDIVTRAQHENGTSVVFTFRPHPQMALRADAKIELINTYEEKIEILESLGVDVVIEQPFNRDFSTISPEHFFNDVLLKKFSTKALYVGHDFGFGKGRSGGIDALKQLCASAGVELRVVSAATVGDIVCSSSRVRDYLKNGDVEAASLLLERPFFYRGLVSKGAGRGHKMGFATANISTQGRVQLKPGVYITRVLRRGVVWNAVTNVGVKPTVTQENKMGVETHILDFHEDIYGETIQVDFLKRLRDEHKFDSIESLIAQIKNDLIEVKRYFSL